MRLQHLAIIFGALAGSSLGEPIWPFILDCANSRSACNNICYGVWNGLPQTITYDTDEQNRDIRRFASGYDTKPCETTDYGSWGDTCHEYPPATTWEGGKGAVLRCVDHYEVYNMTAQFNKFYGRMVNWAKFEVYVKNFQGAYFCENYLSMPNDGAEFTYAGRIPTDTAPPLPYNEHVFAPDNPGPKARRDMEFTEAVPRVAPALKNFRQFEDENGERLALLNRDVGGHDRVGTRVWDDEKEVTIVREIV